jgi:hypothetical protein
MRRVLPFLLLVLTAPVLAARADEPKKADDGPVTAKLVANKTSYTLDLGDTKPDDYKKMLKDAENGGKWPKAPAVDVSLELTNNTDKELTVWVGGDATSLDLDLKGPGAVSIAPKVFFTREFRGPKPVTLEAGKSTNMPIASLSYGFRNASKFAYWTEAGDYTLGATFTTAVSPAPKGSDDAGNGFGKVKLTAEPIKIKVEAK